MGKRNLQLAWANIADDLPQKIKNKEAKWLKNDDSRSSLKKIAKMILYEYSSRSKG